MIEQEALSFYCAHHQQYWNSSEINSYRSLVLDETKGEVER